MFWCRGNGTWCLCILCGCSALRGCRAGRRGRQKPFRCCSGCASALDVVVQEPEHKYSSKGRDLHPCLSPPSGGSGKHWVTSLSSGARWVGFVEATGGSGSAEPLRPLWVLPLQCETRQCAPLFSLFLAAEEMPPESHGFRTWGDVWVGSLGWVCARVDLI